MAKSKPKPVRGMSLEDLKTETGKLFIYSHLGAMGLVALLWVFGGLTFPEAKSIFRILATLFVPIGIEYLTKVRSSQSQPVSNSHPTKFFKDIAKTVPKFYVTAIISVVMLYGFNIGSMKFENVEDFICLMEIGAGAYITIINKEILK